MSGPVPASPQRWQTLPVVLVASFMALFDGYVVNLAAPTIQTRLHASVAETSLAVAAYLITFAAGQIISGRLGDVYGHRRLFVIGMVAFAVTSAACGLAANPAELIAARLAEGAASAVMVPQVLALITALFPDRQERSRAVAWYGVAIGAGSVCGQVAGGVILTANVLDLSWRPLFLINVPIGLITAVAAWRLLPSQHHTAIRGRLDLTGTVFITVTIAMVIGPVALGSQEHWPIGLDAILALSLPAMAGVTAHQRWLKSRNGNPLITADLLGQRSFRAGLAFIAAFMAFLGALNLGMSEYLQGGLRLSALGTGLTFAPLAFVFALTSLFTSRLAHRYGRPVLTVGISVSVLAVAAILVLALLARPHPALVTLIVLFAVIGFGNGLAIPSLYGIALAGVANHQAGVGSGMLNTAQQFANAIGITLVGAIFATAATGYRDDLAHLLVIDLFLLAAALAASRFFPARPSAGQTVMAGDDRDHRAGGLSGSREGRRVR